MAKAAVTADASEPMGTHSGSAAAATPASGSTAPPKRRKQNSACKACSERRVKCNLYDKLQRYPDAPQHLIKCTECENRNMKCVDPHANKQPKRYRRGKVLVNLQEALGTTDIPVVRNVEPQPQQAAIPPLRPEFFQSEFWQRFRLQRPILEPVEFENSYCEFLAGNRDALSREMELISKGIVAWAASYGVDTRGQEEPHTGPNDVHLRKMNTENMLREILHLIDVYSIFRKPSWDGVRAVLLVMPLTEDHLDLLERQTMYENAVFQVYRLFRQGDQNSISFVARARLFWYCHVHEGITSGLRGERLIMEQDIMNQFLKEIRPAMQGSLVHSEHRTISSTYLFATAAVRVAEACRRINAVLTNDNARARPEVDHEAVKDILVQLRTCYDEFESLKSMRVDKSQVQAMHALCDGWKVFLFECQNKIRTTLKERLESPFSFVEEEGDNSGSTVRERTLRTMDIVHNSCLDVAHEVMKIVQRYKGSRMFSYDASLVRDGTFLAALLLAEEPGTDEYLEHAVEALGNMRWGFCRSNVYRERIITARTEATSRMAFERVSRESSASAQSPGMRSNASSGHLQQQSTPPRQPREDRASPASLSPASTTNTNASTLVSPTAGIPPSAPPFYHMAPRLHPAQSMGRSTSQQYVSRGPTAPVQPIQPPTYFPTPSMPRTPTPSTSTAAALGPSAFTPQPLPMQQQAPTQAPAPAHAPSSYYGLLMQPLVSTAQTRGPSNMETVHPSQLHLSSQQNSQMARQYTQAVPQPLNGSLQTQHPGTLRKVSNSVLAVTPMRSIGNLGQACHTIPWHLVLWSAMDTRRTDWRICCTMHNRTRSRCCSMLLSA
ncbi:hypothetical protein BKA62DRAFT_480116 [Auriculariales sp. MPI-PUGE-AT-0066]|nr:hypothetical protein BKA62DRAFT_480116 [Auriculariales sp. MPI-PUGE-AT-0066]